MGLALNLLLSFSLVLIGEYSIFLVLQLSYILFLNRYLIYFLYLPFLHFMLIKLFASSYYFLYFINLSLAILFIINKKILVKKIENLLFLLNLPLIYFLYQYYESDIYHLYLNIDFIDKINYINPEISFILILMHTFILFIIQLKSRANKVSTK